MRGASSALAGGAVIRKVRGCFRKRWTSKRWAVLGNGEHQSDGAFLEWRTSERRYLYLSGRGALGKMRLFGDMADINERWAVWGNVRTSERKLSVNRLGFEQKEFFS